MKINLCVFVILLSLPTMAWSQDDAEAELQAVPPPPDIPDPLQSGQSIEPEVTIIRREDAVIEEYRINGQLYMVKVTPTVGRPYYLIDNDGDGRMEHRADTINRETVPQWIIFSW